MNNSEKENKKLEQKKILQKKLKSLSCADDCISSFKKLKAAADDLQLVCMKRNMTFNQLADARYNLFEIKQLILKLFIEVNFKERHMDLELQQAFLEMLMGGSRYE